MSIQNAEIQAHSFLRPMSGPDDYPQHLVEQGRQFLLQLCHSIESTQPKDLGHLYQLTNETTEQFNQLQEEFEQEASEIDTIAREAICDDLLFIAKVYGFQEADIEQLVAARGF